MGGLKVGSGKITKNQMNLDLNSNQDISILFEGLTSVETPPPMGGCMGNWVGGWGGLMSRFR